VACMQAREAEVARLHAEADAREALARQLRDQVCCSVAKPVACRGVASVTLIPMRAWRQRPHGCMR